MLSLCELSRFWRDFVLILQKPKAALSNNELGGTLENQSRVYELAFMGQCCNVYRFAYGGNQNILMDNLSKLSLHPAFVNLFPFTYTNSFSS